MAASATFAFKAGVWFRRGRLDMVSPDSQATACLPSGRNSTYRLVQISATGSEITGTARIEWNGTQLKIRNQLIHIGRTPCRFGGHRLWFKCACGRHVLALY